MRPVVVKFGGELLDRPAAFAGVVAGLADVCARDIPLVVVHGGGKEIDRALQGAGIEKRQVDGLRITDDATLDVVVAVLAGSINTRFVAALNAAGVRAVGLTGADARIALTRAAAPHRRLDGTSIDLGRVGEPLGVSDPALLCTLVRSRFVPVVACIGAGVDGSLYNVNADTLAGHLAASAGATRLVVAGTTAGVLGSEGETLPLLDRADVADLIRSQTATAGMVAKLRACERALEAGVDDVVIVDGTDRATVAAAASGSTPARATRLVLKRHGGTEHEASPGRQSHRPAFTERHGQP